MIYTPETLAERWQCSPRHIRNLVTKGALPAFRIGGRLLRIRARDVEAIECQSNTDLDDTGANGAQCEDMASNVAALSSVRIARRLRKLSGD